MAANSNIPTIIKEEVCSDDEPDIRMVTNSQEIVETGFDQRILKSQHIELHIKEEPEYIIEENYLQDGNFSSPGECTNKVLTNHAKNSDQNNMNHKVYKRKSEFSAENKEFLEENCKNLKKPRIFLKSGRKTAFKNSCEDDSDKEEKEKIDDKIQFSKVEIDDFQIKQEPEEHFIDDLDEVLMITHPSNEDTGAAKVTQEQLECHEKYIIETYIVDESSSEEVENFVIEEEPEENIGHCFEENSYEVDNSSNGTENPVIKQEPEENIEDYSEEILLEQLILNDCMKKTENFAQLSETCIEKLTELTKKVNSSSEFDLESINISQMRKNSLNTSSKMSRNSQNLQFFKESFPNSSEQSSSNTFMDPKTHTKTVRIDSENFIEIPQMVLNQYSIKKFSFEIEKQHESSVIINNIPYYTCTICSIVFISQSDTFEHFKTTHAASDKPFKCWKCKSDYYFWKNLAHHLKTHDENRTFTCKYCFYPFKVKESLDKHLEKVHSDRNDEISCDICGVRNFDTEEELMDHKGRHSGRRNIIEIEEVEESNERKAVKKQKTMRCIFCSAEFLQNDELEGHYKTHKALEKMKCRGCGKEVMVNPQFVIKDTKMREFKCILCVGPNKAVNNTAAASMKIGFNEIESKEDELSPSTSSATVPTKHSVNNADRTIKKVSVKCYVCGLELSSNIKLFWHMKTHLEQKVFKCPACQKDFKTKKSMLEHCKVEHSKKNTTKCDICKKEFYFVDMKTHMKTHENDKNVPAKTDIVPKKSVELVNKPKPNKPILYGSKCTVCNKYVLNNDMPKHMQIHFDKKKEVLIQNIQNRKKKSDFLNKLKVPSIKSVNLEQ